MPTAVLVKPLQSSIVCMYYLRFLFLSQNDSWFISKTFNNFIYKFVEFFFTTVAVGVKNVLEKTTSSPTTDKIQCRTRIP